MSSALMHVCCVSNKPVVVETVEASLDCPARQLNSLGRCCLGLAMQRSQAAASCTTERMSFHTWRGLGTYVQLSTQRPAAVHTAASTFNCTSFRPLRRLNLKGQPAPCKFTIPSCNTNYFCLNLLSRLIYAETITIIGGITYTTS